MHTAMIDMIQVPGGARIHVGPWDLDHIKNVMAVPMVRTYVNGRLKGGLWFSMPGPMEIAEERLFADFGIEAEEGDNEVVLELIERDRTDGVIRGIEKASESTDLFLSPGLVDMQVNGIAGYDLNSPQLMRDTVLHVVDAMISRGVTCFAPTIITAPTEAICHALATIAEARRVHPKAAACIPFVHIEGPHISPLDGYRGAHPVDAVRPPSIAEFQRWQDAAEGCVGMVTLSPHFS